MNRPEIELTVDVAELAVILKKSPWTVRKLARNGDIPAFKVGKDWRFYPSEVRAHLTRPRTWNQSAQSRGRKRIA